MIFAPIKTIQKYIHPDLHPSWKGQSQNKTKTKWVYDKLKKPRELVTLPAPTGESRQSLRTIMNHEETWKTWLNRKRTKQKTNETDTKHQTKGNYTLYHVHPERTSKIDTYACFSPSRKRPNAPETGICNLELEILSLKTRTRKTWTR